MICWIGFFSNLMTGFISILIRGGIVDSCKWSLTVLQYGCPNPGSGLCLCCCRDAANSLSNSAEDLRLDNACMILDFSAAVFEFVIMSS